jgi:hypothetical protein
MYRFMEFNNLLLNKGIIKSPYYHRDRKKKASFTLRLDIKC